VHQQRSEETTLLLWKELEAANWVFSKRKCNKDGKLFPVEEEDGVDVECNLYLVTFPLNVTDSISDSYNTTSII